MRNSWSRKHKPLGCEAPTRKPSRSFEDYGAIPQIDCHHTPQGADLGTVIHVVNYYTGTTEPIESTGRAVFLYEDECAALSAALNAPPEDDEPAGGFGAPYARRQDSEPWPIIGEVNHLDNGHVVLRFGDLYANGWHQTHYVVLTPKERDYLRNELPQGAASTSTYAARVVAALTPDFPDLVADPAVTRILENKITEYVTDPAGLPFEWILDNPGIARWRLKAGPGNPKQFRVALYVVNQSEQGRQRAERVNARLAAL
jgi:hypothetical protein